MLGPSATNVKEGTTHEDLPKIDIACRGRYVGSCLVCRSWWCGPSPYGASGKFGGASGGVALGGECFV